MKRFGRFGLAIALFVLGSSLGFFLHTRVRANALPAQKEEEKKTVAHQVLLLQDRAEPGTLLVNVGEFVQFNSKDGRSHNLAQGRGNNFGHDHDHEPGLESGIFGPDEAYRVEIKNPGTYFFHDHVHPELSATAVAY